MGNFHDIREDIRLAHLNDGSYGLLFRFIRLLKGIFVLCMVGCFAFGIWYLTYGYSEVPPIVGGDATQAENANLNSSGSEGLSEERIARLREFARNNATKLAGADAKANTPQSAGQRNSEALAVADSVSSTLNSEALIDRTNTVEPNKVEQGQNPESTVISMLQQKLAENLNGKVLAEQTELAGNGEDNEAVDELPVITLQEVVPKPVALPIARATTDNNLEITAITDEVKGSKWMQNQSGEAYVIQIGSTTNLPFQVRFEKSLPSTQPTAIFEMLISGKPEHTLVYGLFDNRDEAVAELGRLSQSARRYGAYVRKISAIQKQISDLVERVAAVQ